MKTRTLWILAGASAPALWLMSAAAAQNGAAKLPADPRMAAIVKSVDATRIRELDTKLVSFGSRLATAEDKSTATRGPVPARAWIQQQFQQISDANGGRLKVRIQTFDIPAGSSRIPAAQTMSNVIATLPGTDPNDKRVFLVGGHYDSIPGDFTQDAPGANDDASGTIVSLECARALAPFKFPATIEFYAYEGEEEGLYGSADAAKEAKAAGLDIAGVLNDDIVGGDQTPGNDNTDKVRAYGQGLNDKLQTPQEITSELADGLENDTPSRELVRYVQMVANRYVPGFHVVLEYRVDRFHRGSDHQSWLAAGFPYSMTFREWMENSNHQHVAVRTGPDGTEYGDIQKWVSPNYIVQVARVNAVALAALASSPMIPEHVYFQAGQQVNDRITWTPVEGAAGYMLLYRGTADPQWSERPIEGKPAAPPAARGNAPDSAAPAPTAPATPMLEATIPESGDTYILAIAAVDAEGHESLPRVAGTPPAGGRGGAGRGRGAAPAAGGGGGNGGGGGF